MAIKELNFFYEEFSSLEECPDIISELFQLACSAAEKAYAPFSEFRVGVAIELENGSIYQASNQENKAYPSGLCAERTGLFYVNSIKPDVAVKRMIIVAFDRDKITEEPVYPCGACRQVMVESEERGATEIETWMIGANRIHKTQSMSVLLPLKFNFSKTADQQTPSIMDH